MKGAREDMPRWFTLADIEVSHEIFPLLSLRL